MDNSSYHNVTIIYKHHCHSANPNRFKAGECKIGRAVIDFAWYSLLNDDPNSKRFVVKARDLTLTLENTPPRDFVQEMDLILTRINKKRKRLLKEWEDFMSPWGKSRENNSFKEVILRRLFKLLDVDISGKIKLIIEGQVGTKNEGSSMQIWARSLSLHPPKSPSTAIGQTYARCNMDAYNKLRIMGFDISIDQARIVFAAAEGR